MTIGFRTINGTLFNDEIYGDERADRVFGHTGDDIIYGQGGSDSLIGGFGNDHLYGDAGNDVLNGEWGDDFLEGGDGIDLLKGGDGQDELDGGNGNDFLHGEAGNDLLMGKAGNDSLFGGSGDDRLFGGSGNDFLSGSTGNDSLYGDTGNDVIVDMRGNNIVDGFSGYDTFSFRDGEANSAVIIDLQRTGLDQVKFTINGVVQASAAVTGIEEFIGTHGGDTMKGSGGVNSFNGGDGNDLLIGRGGADQLTGGYGADMFRFEDKSDAPMGSAIETIRDFDAGLDIIDLSGIDANSRIGGNQAFSMVDHFTGHAGEIDLVSTVVNGQRQSFLFGDVNGDARADFQIFVQHNSAIDFTLSSFLL